MNTFYLRPGHNDQFNPEMSLGPAHCDSIRAGWVAAHSGQLKICFDDDPKQISSPECRDPTKRPIK
ncbi:hypothetical protein SAMD00023353_1101060 [Rosellinia necatrix]|uniref:Uncharacterized protein n=1 Tax=Rosellinia necatrix TaxID=77044 RepID=A0A1S8A6L2_ROSNE|nr:hypothetical protein SAMD00023353_1101060 [Rosellinia necatrix]